LSQNVSKIGNKRQIKNSLVFLLLRGRYLLKSLEIVQVIYRTTNVTNQI